MASEYHEKKVNELIAGGYQFDMGKYISEGWDLFQKNAGAFIGFTALVVVITGIMALIPFIGSVGQMLVVVPLNAGFFIVARKLHRGEHTEFGDFFKGFDYFGGLVLASLIGGVMIVVGLVLLIIPGIYLAIAYSMVTCMVIFARMDFWPALEASRKVISKNWFSFFGFAIVLGLINLLGVICLGVGILVTIPLTYCAAFSAFNHIVGADPPEDQVQDLPTAEHYTSGDQTHIMQ